MDPQTRVFQAAGSEDMSLNRLIGWNVT